ncbi:heme biosynthesis HemY N-terminal domain-containing protein [Glaciimonas sp. CA11.2]|uniref:heme biosynthesis HemY N-terminal domain-containing protein n=1 Tax=unclassified Glaciimonas TaxID=2644401 RepID=UPI002AB3AFD8|nr:MULTISPECIES: heme biosynthesis HemY N-terminal domain-containing protein [unclassified Glaciimonas]MDY7544827.1 heme biosynthesis HemY N-terminal domain-containing protein [Glaciimonas sp. CA11.2]MEB0014311.1 heme biosynthesis HemY N-terminal domain-containing protein [Glaciimonas sp. Cout2]MEB0084118.1 heme biosynthesis HemY N-terminal domain-containing protein [Glaciimonas sp. Gout2]MEB0163665.1 heme biosynthesis HemY N-terminal domain-containing protein [Glaciimonas sp. CA11.2]
MRFFLWLIALFAAAIGLAVAARYNVGNVALFYSFKRIDLSLNFFLLLQALFFIALYILVRAIRTTQKLPGKVISYRRQKREERSNKALRDALKSLFEGRFGQAEKAATRAAELNDNLGVAALIAARAAHRMGQFDRRDIWLSSIEDKEAMKTARLMTTLNLLVDEHKPQAALVAVSELNASGIRHIQALRLALKANQQAKNWPEVLRLVKTLDKHDALNPVLSSRLRELAYDDLLKDASHDAESLQRLWLTIPAEDRVKPSLVIRAASAFTQREMQDEARNMIEKSLMVEWDVRLMRVYRDSVAGEGTPALRTQIERCEAWTAIEPQDPELALTLGTFCLKQKLWGKAQRHLQQALSNATEPRTVREAHLKLAQLHEGLENAEKAAEHYRQCALATMM